jgi:hypothetical protein
MPKIPKKIYWIHRFFKKEIIFTDAFDEPVGNMKLILFSDDVECKINDKYFFFDIRGFFTKEVIIKNDKQQQVGHIKLSTRDKASLYLPDGKQIDWHRKSFFGKEWEMIHNRPDTDFDKLMVSYTTTKSFFGNEGRINLEQDDANEELIVMAGFFISLYFNKRRRRRS